jgi:hypothetical protein
VTSIDRRAGLVKPSAASRSVIAALLAAALLAGTAAGCGGDGDGEEESQPSGVEAAAQAAAERDAALETKAQRLIPIASQSQYGSSKKESLRIADAQAELLAIAEKDPEAIAPLIAALEKPDYELITDMYSFFIQLGQPGSERVLVQALDRQGFTPEGSTMALGFYASGNKRLVQGAREWASEHGASFTGSPGGAGPRWGSGGGLAVPQIPTAPPPTP